VGASFCTPRCGGQKSARRRSGEVWFVDSVVASFCACWRWGGEVRRRHGVGLQYIMISQNMLLRCF
jgi:hypothetical protein